MRLLFLLVVGLLLIGCGGSGGNSNAPKDLGDTCSGLADGRITYKIVWGNSTANASEVILIRDAAGNTISSDTVNRNGASTSTLSNLTVSSGVYEFKVLHYNLPNAGGNPTKEMSRVIDLCDASTTQISANVAEAPTLITIRPKSILMQSNHTKRVVLEATGKSGGSTFVPYGSVTWSLSGSIGKISPVGVITASKTGSGTVQGKIASLGLVAQAPVQVQASVKTKGKWTILVYMNAANDLQPDSDLNMNQMEQVANNPDVRFVVQWKESRSAFSGSTFEGVRRYLVKPDTNIRKVGSELVQDNVVDETGKPLDMGSPKTLLDFINWGKENYPSDRTILVIWNHGNGWKRSPGDSGGRGFSYDDQYGTHIDTWQMKSALGNHKFDILAWDASLMQMLEVAYEARGNALYIAGSEESPPEEGYPYQEVFKAFQNSPDLPTATLSRGFVTGMVNNPLYVDRNITQSVIDTSKLTELKLAIDTLGSQLFANRIAMTGTIQKARTMAQAYSPTGLRVYRDLYDLCRLIRQEASTPTAVKDAAKATQIAVINSLVWEGHNSQSPMSRGISIEFGSGPVFQNYRPDYLKLMLAIDSTWDEFLTVSP